MKLRPWSDAGGAMLYAPESYVAAAPIVRGRVVNGCGTAGWKGALVPETMYGLVVTPACNIHDWMYIAGSTIDEKDEADRCFLNNLLRLIDAAGGPVLLRWLRRRRARTYYEAVHLFGGPAFWSSKNPVTNTLTALEALEVA